MDYHPHHNRRIENSAAVVSNAVICRTLGGSDPFLHPPCTLLLLMIYLKGGPGQERLGFRSMEDPGSMKPNRA
jgi:hypothetical protein